MFFRDRRGGRLVTAGFGLLILTGLYAVPKGLAMGGVTGLRFWLAVLLIGGFGGALGLGSLWQAIMPFGLHIGPDGITVRSGRSKRFMRWDEIEEVSIGAPTSPRKSSPRLLVRWIPPGEPPATLNLIGLDELDAAPRQLLSVLREFSGGRFREPFGLPLRTFPIGKARRRAVRWLARRRALAIAVWYLGVLAPFLVLVWLAAGLHDGIGVLTLVAGGFGVVIAAIAVASAVPTKLQVVQAPFIRGGHLVLDYASGTKLSLRAGAAVVVPAGTFRQWPKAWILAETLPNGLMHPHLLLGDPLTGQLRPRADLLALAGELSASPSDSDRSAAKALLELAAKADRHPDAGEQSRPHNEAWLDEQYGKTKVSQMLAMLAWVTPAAGVIVAVAVAAGAVSGLTQALLLMTAAVLCGMWGFAMLLVLIYLVGAAVAWIWSLGRRT